MNLTSKLFDDNASEQKLDVNKSKALDLADMKVLETTLGGFTTK